MNRPLYNILLNISICQRKEGDSNPRYGNPYGSLANCWFQPLTHPSSKAFVLAEHYFLMRCKGSSLFLFRKIFRIFFLIKLLNGYCEAVSAQGLFIKSLKVERL